MIAGLIIIAAIAIVGCIANYLLYTRAGPFAPFSAWSASLGLDSGPIPTQSPLAASVATISPGTAGNATITTPTSPATQPPAASVSTPVATPKQVSYLTINGANMPGQDLAVDVGGKSVTSQGTYGPSGCTAICSSNDGCVASVYKPSTKTCWIKSGYTEGNVVGDSDSILAVAGASQKGSQMFSTSFTGPDIISPVLPTFGDCSTLCQTMNDCAGVVYDNTYGKACHLKSAMSKQVGNPDTNAWVKAAQH